MNKYEITIKFSIAENSSYEAEEQLKFLLSREWGDLRIKLLESKLLDEGANEELVRVNGKGDTVYCRNYEYNPLRCYFRDNPDLCQSCLSRAGKIEGMKCYESVGEK